MYSQNIFFKNCLSLKPNVISDKNEFLKYSDSLCILNIPPVEFDPITHFLKASPHKKSPEKRSHA